MSTSDAWQATLAADAEEHHGWPVYADVLVIQNLGDSPVWVATDGGTATVGGDGLDVVEPNWWGVYANRQPRQDAITSAPGSTAQQLTVPTSGALTYVSLISSGTPQIVVSPQ